MPRSADRSASPPVSTAGRRLSEAVARARCEAITIGIRVLARVPTPWVPRPREVVRRLLELRRWAVGFREREVEVEGFKIPYLEAGRGEPLVLLHGFADRKDAFVEVVRQLTHHRRVLLPDLPGFSDTRWPAAFCYSIANQARLLHGLLDSLGVADLHLGGASLGGAIAAAFATEQPQRVRSLTLIAPSGVRMPTASELERRLVAGINPFAVRGLPDYLELVGLVTSTRPPYPAAVYPVFAAEQAERFEMNSKIMDDILEESLDLTERLDVIECPTLLLWGGRDRVIHPSVGRVYHRRISGSRLMMFHGVGHVPHYEIPDRIAAVITAFHRELGR